MNKMLFDKRNSKYNSYNQSETIESLLVGIKDDLQSYMQIPFEQRVQDRFKSMQEFCSPDTMSSIEDLRRYEKESDENFNRIIAQTPEEYYLSDRPLTCCITGKIIPYGEHYYVPKKQYVDEVLCFSKYSMGVITEEIS